MLKKRNLSSRIASKNFTISRLLPNMVTITAICFGLTSIRYALDNKLEIAVGLVVIAGLLDMADGRIARYLKATSNFGAQLDSLADFIDFGVAPAIIIYIWKLKEVPIHGLGWALVLFFSVCCVIRLARFNVDSQNETLTDFYKVYFVGVPAPMGAYIIGIPMMIEFNPYFDFHFSYYIVGFFTLMAGLLMVSRLPTIAAKQLSVKSHNINFAFAVFAIIIALLIMEPWFILPLIGILYLLSIPVTWYIYKNKMLIEK